MNLGRTLGTLALGVVIGVVLALIKLDDSSLTRLEVAGVGALVGLVLGAFMLLKRRARRGARAAGEALRRRR